MTHAARSPLQFAVVREDPLVDFAALGGRTPRRALLVGSGGCTALAFHARFPHAEVTVIDPNAAQLAHIEAKADALRNGGRRMPERFNVMNRDPDGLSERGNFESIFRMLRGFVHDLVLPYREWLAFFRGESAMNPLEAVVDNPYWPVAFELAFDDRLLETMFGPAATQHAPPGSYPAYFRAAFERGLAAGRANPFLHHVFLGHYLPDVPPEFLRRPPTDPSIELRQATAQQTDFSRYDFVGLSNIFDWMADDGVDLTTSRLARDTAEGAIVVWRQLNNRRPIASKLDRHFRFDKRLGRALRARDRSLFYSEVHIGTRTSAIA